MILNVYEEFIAANSEVVEYINNIIVNDLVKQDTNIRILLEEKLKKIENLKYESDKLAESGFDIEKINRLRYSIMNCLFLLSDLIHFYNLNEFERFKMRGLNYINQNSR